MLTCQRVDKKTLVFDLDETLIHCNESLDMPADVVIKIHFPNGDVVEVKTAPNALSHAELGGYQRATVCCADLT